MEVTLIALFQVVTATFNLPPGLIDSICWVESSHKVGAIKREDGGSASHGICMVKEGTARMLGYKGSIEQLRYDSATNVYYAGKYLSSQLTRYKGNTAKAVAAYNSGTARLDKHGRIRNYRYVDKVNKKWLAAK